MIYRRLDLHAPAPDETTYCRFRNALVRGGVYDDLLAMAAIGQNPLKAANKITLNPQTEAIA